MNYNVASVYIIDWSLLVNHVNEYIEFDLIWFDVCHIPISKMSEKYL